MFSILHRPRVRKVRADVQLKLKDRSPSGIYLVSDSVIAAPFDYGARLTEFSILANLAQRAGVNNKVEWDGPNMKVTNIAELNEWVSRPYRKGWVKG
jgi:hypothetical protein